MNDAMRKLLRFVWRASRNFICAIPGAARILFPPEALANRFGRGDAEYALHVYAHHAAQLEQAGFRGAANILEIGPGRNLGSALLWWLRSVSEGRNEAVVHLWDVHANAHPESTGYWPNLAGQLLEQLTSGACPTAIHPLQQKALADVAAGLLIPKIFYHVCQMDLLEAAIGVRRFDLIYSHAALEHVWKIGQFWPLAARLSAAGGWHSHRIDLADHGRRESNYIEMLEWSPVAWWLTMRFIPGALNRWRAGEFEAAIEQAGIAILARQREERDSLPIERYRLATQYRALSEAELKTTAIDIVGRRLEETCAF